MHISKVYQVSDEEFKKIIEENYTYSDCLVALGLAPRGGSSTDILKKELQNYIVLHHILVKIYLKKELIRKYL